MWLPRGYISSLWRRRVVMREEGLGELGEGEMGW